MSYKWWQSTRLYLLLMIALVASIVWLLGGAHAKYFSAAMTTDQWTNFMQWIYGTYAASEAARHVGNAMGNVGADKP